MKESDNVMQLMDFLQTEVSIVCDKCRYTAKLVNVDDFMAAERFDETGWTAKDGKISCPKCSKI